MRLRCGGGSFFSDYFIANLLLSTSEKNLENRSIFDDAILKIPAGYLLF